MPRIVFCLLCLIILSAVAAAQTPLPRAELGITYSYSYAGVPNSSTRVNMNGIVLDSTFNANHWLGMEAEFGSHYHCVSGCWIDGLRVDNPDETNDSLSFLAGPKITLSRNSRFSPWVHALAGVTRTSYSNHNTDTKIASSGFGWAAGGGLDWSHRHWSLRAIQVDFVHYASEPSGFNNVRVGTGVVLNLGRLYE